MSDNMHQFVYIEFYKVRLQRILKLINDAQISNRIQSPSPICTSVLCRKKSNLKCSLRTIIWNLQNI